MMKILLILFVLILPALAYPPLLVSENFTETNQSFTWTGGNASDHSLIILTQSMSIKDVGSVRYGYGNYSIATILPGQGHMIAYIMQEM